MGGKSKPDNSQIVQQQQQQAAEQAQKEADRQARLKTGLASIKAAFEGTPTMAATTGPYDWSKFKPEGDALSAASWGADPLSGTSSTATMDMGVPAGYTAVQVAPRGTGAGGAAIPYDDAGVGPPAGQPVNTGLGGSYVQSSGGFGPAATFVPDKKGSGAGGGDSVWALQDANGKTYYQGDPFDVTTQTPTGGTTGGFDDAFYNKYKQSVLDYYMPQVDDQYKKAKDQATYGLARSGNLQSSAAATLTADLSKQNDINAAGVRNQADTAAGDLRSQVSSEEQKAISQLYATEDPEIAAQQSLASVRDISLKQPDLSPLSALFNVATIGGANIFKGYQGQQNLNAFNQTLGGGAAKDRSTIV